MSRPLGIPLSVLDVVPVFEGGSATQALRDTVALAPRVEELGYLRYWVAEHHSTPSLATSAPAILAGRLAAATTTLRVGSGGVLLPNHAPLVVAEQFGTLEALHPGRVDLGLGRAPGTDPHTARALRRAPERGGDDFFHQVAELNGYFAPADPSSPITAVAGSRRQAGPVDARLQPGERRARRIAGTAVRLRPPDQPACHGLRAGPLPRDLPPLAPSGPAAHPDLRADHRRRHGPGRP